MPDFPTHYERERHQLASSLRYLRKQSGLTGSELAARIGVSQSKISKIETGQLTPSVADITRIAEALGVSVEVRDELLDRANFLLAEATSWRLLHRRGVKAVQDEIRDLERRASEIRLFQPLLVPGLLQTAEYARQILHSASLAPIDDVAEGVAARLERQRILYDTTKTFTFVIMQAALHHQFGSPTDMLAQLDRILSIETLKNVSIGIIPFEAQLPRVPANSYCIYDDDLVDAEVTLDYGFERDPARVHDYIADFAAFAEVARFGRAGRVVVDSVARTYRAMNGTEDRRRRTEAGPRNERAA